MQFLGSPIFSSVYKEFDSMTRIAVSASDEKGLDSVVSPHFGRCPYFTLVDVEADEIKATQAVPNPYYGKHQPGQVPDFICSQQADVMLTGGMGGRAVAFFEQYGIQAATGASGIVRDAVAQYLEGQLQGVEPCSVSTEHTHGEGSVGGEPGQHRVGARGGCG
jgi:predicted Fe-Mo cluster-binding NifX family protein